jgi:hypothetical protein
MADTPVVRTSTPAITDATDEHIRRHDGARTVGSHRRLIDTRTVRAELVRLRGAHMAPSWRHVPSREHR